MYCDNNPLQCLHFKLLKILNDAEILFFFKIAYCVAEWGLSHA